MRVAFCGKMRAGKDTAYEFFRSQINGVHVKFADPLYEMQDVIYRIAKLPPLEKNQKDRNLLQLLGTQWGRETINTDIWLNLFKIRLKDLEIPLGNVFNTDARFENEIKLLKKIGFRIVYIEVNDEVCINRGAIFTNHESEQYMKTFKDWDYKINNDGSMEEYKSALQNLLNLFRSIDNE